MKSINIEEMIRPHLRDIEAYEPVDPSEVMAQEAGISLDRVIRLNGNENPFGCSPKAAQAVASMTSFHIYPDPQQRAIRKTLSRYTKMDLEYIVAGSGCDEIIDLLLRLFLEPGDEVLECEPTFGMYSFNTRVSGGRVVSVPRNELFDVDVDAVSKAIGSRTKVVFIASPNNPTGNLTSEEHVRVLLETGIMVVVDETYHEFAKATLAHLVPHNENLVILRSLSKWAGLAGLRVGYGIMSPRLVKRVIGIKPPYNVNVAAEAALLASMEDAPALLQRVDAIVEERKRFVSFLMDMKPVATWPSHANFVLCQFEPGNGYRVYRGLASRGIFVRYFNTPRLKDCLRISIGTREQMDETMRALQELL